MNTIVINFDSALLYNLVPIVHCMHVIERMEVVPKNLITDIVHVISNFYPAVEILFQGSLFQTLKNVLPVPFLEYF